jgi:hypothetical protein
MQAIGRRRGLTLGDHCKSTFGVLLDALIQEGVASRENVEDNLWKQLCLVTNSSASIDNASRSILSSSLGVNDGLSVLNLTTVTSVGLDEDIDEVAKNLFVRSTLNDNKAPRLQWLGIGEQELLTAEVPTA